jgi:tryptophan-rich sensory protein
MSAAPPAAAARALAGPLLRQSLVAAALALAVASCGGALTHIGAWYGALIKPSWQPPNWLFGPAWTLIFSFIACAAVVAWRQAVRREQRVLLLGVLALNAVLNVLWSLLFFHLRRPDWALVEVVPLWLSILLIVVVVRRWSRRAAWLLAPYLAWVAFAAYLNLTLVRLNGL